MIRRTKNEFTKKVLTFETQEFFDRVSAARLTTGLIRLSNEWASGTLRNEMKFLENSLLLNFDCDKNYKVPSVEKDIITVSLGDNMFDWLIPKEWFITIDDIFEIVEGSQPDAMK